jgi:hypothetical protein
MTYKISAYEPFVASVTLAEGIGVDEIHLDDETRVFIDKHGTMLGFEVDNLPRFGVPFDQAAAERAVAWVRERFEAPTAS